jgi:hypothetical protein
MYSWYDFFVLPVQLSRIPVFYILVSWYILYNYNFTQLKLVQFVGEEY